MMQLHDCQPAILAPEAYDAWLESETPAAEVKPLLGSNLDGQLQFHRVDRKVNLSNRTDKPNETHRWSTRYERRPASRAQDAEADRRGSVRSRRGWRAVSCLRASGAAEQQSEERAIRTAKSLATKHVGVIAWSRDANPAIGE
jgi:hypothetical protein